MVSLYGQKQHCFEIQLMLSNGSKTKNADETLILSGMEK